VVANQLYLSSIAQQPIQVGQRCIRMSTDREEHRVFEVVYCEQYTRFAHIQLHRSSRCSNYKVCERCLCVGRSCDEVLILLGVPTLQVRGSETTAVNDAGVL
jgi:hypothetical protein